MRPSGLVFTTCVLCPCCSKCGPWDQQHPYHLGACGKCGIWGPSPDLLNQNLHFNMIPKQTCVHIKVLDILHYEVSTITLCLKKLAEVCTICKLAEPESESRSDWLQKLLS